MQKHTQLEYQLYIPTIDRKYIHLKILYKDY